MSIFEYIEQLHEETLKKEGRFTALCEFRRRWSSYLRACMRQNEYDTNDFGTF